MPDARKLVVGLIGGIGSGKSLVAAELARHGGLVISGDRLGHEALRQPEILTRIVQRWGTEVLDGEGNVDRRRLGAKVFVDANERKALEGLSFPFIECSMSEQIAAARRDPNVPFIVLDAAIMLEAGWDRHCDVLVFVDAPRELRVHRLKARGFDESEVAARERAQWPVRDKSQRADLVIDNSGSPESLARQVGDLVQRWSARPDAVQKPAL